MEVARVSPISGTGAALFSARHKDPAPQNAMLYKTRNGARVGDLFMSLIYTCQLNRANPFDYLTECSSIPTRLRRAPSAGCRGTTAK